MIDLFHEWMNQKDKKTFAQWKKNIFPLDFIFKGSTISQQQQVGNSVPPILAKEIALTIKKMMKNDEQIS